MLASNLFSYIDWKNVFVEKDRDRTEEKNKAQKSFIVPIPEPC